MALQSDSDLALLGLGIRGDVPEDVLQPPLADGVHLRWAFGKNKAFPWHGYYLLRRPQHERRELRCLRDMLRHSPELIAPLAPGSSLPLGSSVASLPDGNFSSDQPLVITEDFPPPGLGELDLRNRQALRFEFAAAAVAHLVTYSVGLRRERDEGFLSCMRFREQDAGAGPNPRIKDALKFTTFDFNDAPSAQTQVRSIGGAYGLDLDRRVDIELPCRADRVSLLIIDTAADGVVRGLDASGRVVAQEAIPRSIEPRVIDIRGEGIATLTVVAPQGEIFLLALCYRCMGRSGAVGPILARAFAGTVLLEEQTVAGAPGAVVSGQFNHDLITAVEFTGGSGALVDLCFSSVLAAVRGGGGWELVPECPQPITLPVRNAAYPANGSLPSNMVASENEAVGRIRYGNPNVWRGGRFAELHGGLQQLVAGGPTGPAMQAVASNNVVGTSAAGSGQMPPSLTTYRPLNFIVTGSLHAAVAQMLGLYWVDRMTRAGRKYDYLIVADHANVGQHQGAKMLAWLTSSAVDFTVVDAWFKPGLEPGTPAPLAAPTGLDVYALPGGTIDQPDGSLRDATNNAGLHWDVPAGIDGKLLADAPVMYRVRRASVGETQPATSVPEAAHFPVSDNPRVVSIPKATGGVLPQWPADWPPFPLHFLDAALPEGWHSYRVNAVDLFGRYSRQSAPAVWHQWTPDPRPKPWYYVDGLGSGVIHAHAVRLLDKLPPPAPTGVEAFALDPRDPLLQRDAPLQSWWSTLNAAEQRSTLGLRVRWLWTYAQMRQAPDTTEFRVYFEPGQPNTVKGRIVSVTPAGAGQSAVATDVSLTMAPNAFANLYLRSDGRSYLIVGNPGGATLNITVKNLAADAAPIVGQTFVISLTPAQSQYKEYRVAHSWRKRIWVVPYAAATAEGVIPATVAGGKTLAGFGAAIVGSSVTFPPGTDLSGIKAFTHHVYLADDLARPSRIYRVQSINAAARTAMLDGVPSIASSAWELGTYVRRYEVFLPAANDSDRTGLPLTASLTDPIVYAQIGVTAADGKFHTPDDPLRAGMRWSARPGNESAIGGPATLFRVHRDPPPPPAMPPDSDDVFATRADYSGNSWYTFRWVPLDNVQTRIFRAMDDALFARDWLVRSTRRSLSTSEATHAKIFPGWWTAARRNSAAAALNAIGGPGGYAGLSADARELLGRLPGNEGLASVGGLDQRDWSIRHTRSALGLADGEFFPSDWSNPLKRQQAANASNAIANRNVYRTLSNDAMRVLAALPGNEAAFQQLTPQPLPNTGAATANRLGPDNPPAFFLNPGLRAYVDRLDGRSTNRYFYRAAFVDGAQNVGPLGLSSPPVRLPDIVPPRMPVFTRVLAGDADPSQPGDGKITLRWASNRELDLAAYRIYRTADPDAVRDIRLMQLIHEMAVAAADPMSRPAEVVWTDIVPAALVTYSYRLVAVDGAGNASFASPAISARAYDTALPEVPVLALAWVTVAGKTRAEISWTSLHQVMVQRREGSGAWIDLAQWREPGSITVRDPFSEPTHGYQYRPVVRKSTGATQRGTPVVLAAENL